MRVCVIGAGAAGLISSHHLGIRNIDHVVYEQTDSPGGTWNFSPSPGGHSSMYRDLRTNLPIDIMGYPGFTYENNDTPFSHRSIVEDYLHNFYEQNVKKYNSLQFNRKVTRTTFDGESRTWSVETRRVSPKTQDSCSSPRDETPQQSAVTSETFTHVIVAIGRYSVPRLPSIEGLEDFGFVIHSHNYREPETFKDKRVLVIGAGPSGVDISVEVSRHAKQTIISHRQAKLSLPECIRQVGSVEKFTKKSALLATGESLDIDAVILCTGYLITFPFCEDIIVCDGYSVPNLFRHSVFIPNPSIVILGLPARVIPNLLFNYQALHAVKLFLGEMQLPSGAAIAKENEPFLEERKKLGIEGDRFGHDVRGRLLWMLLDLYVADGLGEYDPALRRMFEATQRSRTRDLVAYRDRRLEWETVEEGKVKRSEENEASE